MKKYKLSHSEEYVMDLFWRSDRPLTSVELLSIATDVTWSSNYLLKILGMLQSKGLIAVCGMVRDGKHYVRQFTVCETKEEFLSNMLLAEGVDTLSFAKIAMAFVKRDKSCHEAQAENDDTLIAELEEIIARFEQAHKEDL